MPISPRSPLSARRQEITSPRQERPSRGLTPSTTISSRRSSLQGNPDFERHQAFISPRRGRPSPELTSRMPISPRSSLSTRRQEIISPRQERPSRGLTSSIPSSQEKSFSDPSQGVSSYKMNYRRDRQRPTLLPETSIFLEKKTPSPKTSKRYSTSSVPAYLRKKLEGKHEKDASLSLS